MANTFDCVEMKIKILKNPQSSMRICLGGK